MFQIHKTHENRFHSRTSHQLLLTARKMDIRKLIRNPYNTEIFFQDRFDE